MPTEPIVPRGYGPGAVPPGYQWTGDRWESPAAQTPQVTEFYNNPYQNWGITLQSPSGNLHYGRTWGPDEVFHEWVKRAVLANPNAPEAVFMSPGEKYDLGILKAAPTAQQEAAYRAGGTFAAPNMPNVSSFMGLGAVLRKQDESLFAQPRATPPTTPSVPTPGAGAGLGRPTTPYRPFQLPGYNAATPGAATIAPFGAQASGGGIRTMSKPSFGLPSYYSQPWPYNRR